MRGRLDSKGVRYGKVIDFKCEALPQLARLKPKALRGRLALIPLPGAG